MSMSPDVLQSLADRMNREAGTLSQVMQQSASPKSHNEKMTIEEANAAIEMAPVRTAASLYSDKDVAANVRTHAGNLMVEALQHVLTSHNPITLKDAATLSHGVAEAIRHNMCNYPDVGGHGEQTKRALNRIHIQCANKLDEAKPAQARTLAF